MFLTEKDYYRTIRKEVLDVILTEAADSTGLTEEEVRIQAELYVEELIAGYLTAQYDVDELLKNYLIYLNTEDYVTGDFIYDEAGNSFYTAIQDAPAGTALSDTAFFTQKDTRQQLIIQFYIDLVLFEIHKSINPRNIPDLRIDARNFTIDYLKMSIDPRSNITPRGWTKKTMPTRTGTDISWGSSPKTSHGQNSY